MPATCCQAHTAPGSARYDRQVKRLRYQRQGIPEYWIVDLDSRIFERWRPGDERPEVLHETLVWSPEANTSSLRVDIGAYFSEVLGG